MQIVGEQMQWSNRRTGDMGGHGRGDTVSDNVERGWPRVAWSSDTASVVKHTLCPP